VLFIEPTHFTHRGKIEMAEIPTPTSGYSAPSGARPLGVTILALLQIIGGLLALLGGAVLLIIPFIGWIIGGVIIIIALFDLLIGWGLWSMKSWAWMAAIILNLISLILSLATGFTTGSFDWIGIIIDLIIILYLQQADIKSRFR
jgi:uncharacterized membrane protein (DUF2068 family)